MRILNGIMVNKAGQCIKDGFVDFADGKITACGCLSEAPEYSGEVLDANGGYIMPGLIDAHTHIGIVEMGMRWEGTDCNESTEAVTPELRALDGFNPFDAAVKRSVEAGVTCAGVSPGSTNVIAGQIAAIKLYGRRVDAMTLKPYAAMKFALGENPKSYHGNNGRKPKTRMAVAAIMRDCLTRTLQYIERRENGEKVYDQKLEALVPVVKREVPVHFHAHQADDIVTAMRIADEFHLKYNIVHATDADRIIDYMAEAGNIPMMGPSLGVSLKPETARCSCDTCANLYRAGVEVSMTTDHDVQPLWMLPYYASFYVREGLPEDAAFRAITINAAKCLGVEDRIGSLEPGKDADIAVFDGHPFHYMTHTSMVFVDGNRIK